MDVGQLDATSAILGALAAGGGAGITEIAKETLTNNWERLVAAVRLRLSDSDDDLGVAKLAVYASEPTPESAASLKPHLAAALILEDNAIESLAREVLASAGPQAVGAGSVAANVLRVTARDNASVYIGGNQQIYQSPATERPPDPR